MEATENTARSSRNAWYAGSDKVADLMVLDVGTLVTTTS
jgi:hypothetical protein